METLIVTKHKGLVEWLADRHGITGQVLQHVGVEDVRGRRVVGVLPPPLAAEAVEVLTVEMPLLRQDQRGVDLTPAEMDAAGARLFRYRVVKLD
jgi:putative CRISPR-associated protein (TIGR02620 family)